MHKITEELHKRGMTIGKLADLCNVGRTQLNLMFSGEREGKNSWKHVDPFLQPAERNVLRGTTKSYREFEKSKGYTPRTEVTEVAVLGEEDGNVEE